MGKFFALEGIDGAGLTTQTYLLANYLRKKGFEVVVTKEPTHGLIGGLIRAALRNEWKTSQDTLQLLFSADRAHHLRTEIIPALKNGKIVAVKVHAVTASNFKRIWPYLQGDPRFYRIKRTRHGIIYTWCKKEFKNLVTAYKANVLCPEPIAQMNNVIVMEFLGKDFTPAPRLCAV